MLSFKVGERGVYWNFSFVLLCKAKLSYTIKFFNFNLVKSPTFPFDLNQDLWINFILHLI